MCDFYGVSESLVKLDFRSNLVASLENMNQIEREQDRKARRRVALWLASGVGAVVALGLAGVGATALAAQAASVPSNYSLSANITTSGLIVNPAAVIKKLSANEEVQHPASTQPSGYSPASVPANDPQPAPKPVPKPVPKPTPTPIPAPSDDTNHDGHPDNNGHAHADDDTASKEVPSSQDS